MIAIHKKSNKLKISLFIASIVAALALLCVGISNGVLNANADDEASSEFDAQQMLTNHIEKFGADADTSDELQQYSYVEAEEDASFKNAPFKIGENEYIVRAQDAKLDPDTHEGGFVVGGVNYIDPIDSYGISWEHTTIIDKDTTVYLCRYDSSLPPDERQTNIYRGTFFNGSLFQIIDGATLTIFGETQYNETGYATGGSIYGGKYDQFSTTPNGTYNEELGCLCGDAVYVEYGTLDFRGGIISYCASEAGGAVYLSKKGKLKMGSDEEKSDVLSRNSYFNTNTASLSFHEPGKGYKGLGGAVFCDGGTIELGPGSHFGSTSGYSLLEKVAQGNIAQAAGGAIYARNNSTITMNGKSTWDEDRICPILCYNQAWIDGGAICAVDSNIYMNQAVIAYNSSDWDGGGIYIYGNSTDPDVPSAKLDMRGGAIQNNVCERYGGGINAVGGVYVNLYGRDIEYNEAGFGGGVYVSSYSDMPPFPIGPVTPGPLPDIVSNLNAEDTASSSDSILAKLNIDQEISVTSNRAYVYGGGIAARYVDVDFRFGQIDHNIVEQSDWIWEADYNYAFGGGMYLYSSVLNMYDNGTVDMPATISNNETKMKDWNYAQGGGIYSEYSTLNLYGGEVYGNSTSGYGGGVSAFNSYVNCDVADGDWYNPNKKGIQIKRNSAANGGGIYFETDRTANSDTVHTEAPAWYSNEVNSPTSFYNYLYLTRANISNNSAIICKDWYSGSNRSGNGGGIYLGGGSRGHREPTSTTTTAFAYELTLDGNTAGQFGGGLYVGMNAYMMINTQWYNYSTDSWIDSVTDISDNLIESSQGYLDADGAGIYNIGNLYIGREDAAPRPPRVSEGPNPQVINTNSFDQYGATAYGAEEVHSYNCKIYDNKIKNGDYSYGAGIANFHYARILDTEIYNNESEGQAGGIYNGYYQYGNEQEEKVDLEQTSESNELTGRTNMSLMYCLVHGNKAAYYAGISNDSEMLASQIDVYENFAGEAAAIANFAYMEIDDSKIHNNTLTGEKWSAGLYVSESRSFPREDAATHLTNVSITDNLGGGVFVDTEKNQLNFGGTVVIKDNYSNWDLYDYDNDPTTPNVANLSMYYDKPVYCSAYSWSYDEIWLDPETSDIGYCMIAYNDDRPAKPIQSFGQVTQDYHLIFEEFPYEGASVNDIFKYEGKVVSEDGKWVAAPQWDTEFISENSEIIVDWIAQEWIYESGIDLNRAYPWALPNAIYCWNSTGEGEHSSPETALKLILQTDEPPLNPFGTPAFLWDRQHHGVHIEVNEITPVTGQKFSIPVYAGIKASAGDDRVRYWEAPTYAGNYSATVYMLPSDYDNGETSELYFEAPGDPVYAELDFDIIKPLSNNMVHVYPPSFAYDGTLKEPYVYVEDEGRDITREVFIGGQTEAVQKGTYTILVDGLYKERDQLSWGAYYNQATANWTIDGGITPVESDWFEYYVDPVSNSATIIGLNKDLFGQSGPFDIIVPAFFGSGFNAVPVKEIAAGAFSKLPEEQRDKIRSVDFSQASNLVKIGDGAFQNCRNLESVDFGDGLKPFESPMSIGVKAFSGCESLSGTLTITNKVSSIGSEAFAGTNYQEIVFVAASMAWSTTYQVAENAFGYLALTTHNGRGYNKVGTTLTITAFGDNDVNAPEQSYRAFYRLNSDQAEQRRLRSCYLETVRVNCRFTDMQHRPITNASGLNAWSDTSEAYRDSAGNVIIDGVLVGTTNINVSADVTADFRDGQSVTKTIGAALSGRPVFVDIELQPKIDTNATYAISSAVNLSYVIDVDSNSPLDGTNVNIYEYNKTSAQDFKLVPYNGYFYIQNAYTGKVLDVNCASATPGTNVQMYTFNGSPAQLWTPVHNSDGSYTFVSALGSDLVLDLYGGIAQNETNIQIYTANCSNAQKFYLLELQPKVANSVIIEDGVYTINLSYNQNYCMDIADASLLPCANVQLYQANGTVAQKFKFTKTSSGFYTIQSLASGMYLDVANASIIPATNVWQYPSIGQMENLAQLWSIQPYGDSFVLQNVATGLCMDVYGGVGYNACNICGYMMNNSTAQMWTLNKVD